MFLIAHSSKNSDRRTAALRLQLPAWTCSDSQAPELILAWQCFLSTNGMHTSFMAELRTTPLYCLHATERSAVCKVPRPARSAVQPARVELGLVEEVVRSSGVDEREVGVQDASPPASYAIDLAIAKVRLPFFADLDA